MGALRRAERVPELQSAKDEPSPLDVQVAVAVPQTTSPLFGQQGVDGADVSYEADALAKEVPQKITPDLSNAESSASRSRAIPWLSGSTARARHWACRMAGLTISA